MVAQKPTDIDLEQLRCARDRGPELPRLMGRHVPPSNPDTSIPDPTDYI
jgi:hypothetical protein